ncbi:MAG: hypothetical protein HY075_08560 [Deltaproteobacteria bacterium]|nr:hypothetical protein [Deltaproteobacteria bacterium]
MLRKIIVLVGMLACSTPSLATTTLERVGMKRFYLPGDNWVVAVRFASPGFVRKNDGEGARSMRYLDPQYYEFRVLDVEPDGTSRIDVAQIGIDGQTVDTARVRHVVITVNSELRLSAKEYHYRDLEQPVLAELSSDRNFPMGFDSFPVELPDFEKASAVAKLGLDGVSTLELRSKDLFARPLLVSWRSGDLWPTRVESHAGVSTLVRQQKIAGIDRVPMPQPTPGPGPGPRPAPTTSSAPGRRATGYYDETNLAYLMKRYSKATADPVPWAGYWWPYRSNGIASAEADAHGESPASKADLAQGNTNWIVGWEYANHGWGRAAEDWWGHCNGWATAAIMESEPRQGRRVNDVEFTVADRKALLSEYWLESGADFIGTRVYDPNDFSSDAFWDVVPSQFHLLLANVVGRQKRSVIIDRHTGAEVWNQPLVAYEMRAITRDDDLGSDPDNPGLHRVNLETTIWWASDEVDAGDLTPEFKWRENVAFAKRTLRYELWLDGPLEFDSKGELKRSGNIVGGIWKNGTNPEYLVDTHPDFIWVPLSYATSSGEKNPRLDDRWVYEHIR